MCDTDTLINYDTLQLPKHTIMTCIHIFIPINFSWNYNLAGYTVVFDQLIVHTCRMCPQDQIFSSLILLFQKKCIVHFSSWMCCWYIERKKILILSDNLMSIFDHKSQRLTNLKNMVSCSIQQMTVSLAWCNTRHPNINQFCR